MSTRKKTQRSLSGKKNLADSRKKRNVKRRSTRKDPPALSDSSAAAIVPGKTDNPIQQAAAAQSAIELMDETIIENMPCEILPAQAAPWKTDQFAEPAPSAENEIHCDCGVPAEIVSSAEVSALCEPELLPESMAPAPCDTHAPEQLPFAVDGRKFRTALMDVWALLTMRMTQAWSWTQRKLRSQQARKRLRVCESVSLGEKRFVAVIQVDGEQFLVGGSSSSVATLAHLERTRDFSDVFQRRYEQDLSRA